jgi:hypothetical protein
MLESLFEANWESFVLSPVAPVAKRGAWGFRIRSDIWIIAHDCRVRNSELLNVHRRPVEPIDARNTHLGFFLDF